VYLAVDGSAMYGITVERDGNAWTTSLISFISESEDRLYTHDAPTVPEITVSVPAADVPSLPASFQWWAWSDSSRRPPAGNYLGDDCPNGASENGGSSPDLARFPA
jgi:hypothetical protein